MFHSDVYDIFFSMSGQIFQHNPEYACRPCFAQPDDLSHWKELQDAGYASHQTEIMQVAISITMRSLIAIRYESSGPRIMFEVCQTVFRQGMW